MILLRMAGGLGNQLFQLSAAKYINIRFPNHELLIYQNSINNYLVKHEFLLNKIFIVDDFKFEKKLLFKLITHDHLRIIR